MRDHFRQVEAAAQAFDESFTLVLGRAQGEELSVPRPEAAESRYVQLAEKRLIESA